VSSINKKISNKEEKIAQKENWKVYMLLTSDGRLYTGITTNMPKRWRKHCAKKGAKFFYGRHPIALNYLEGQHTRSSASQREYQIKKLNRIEKWQLILNNYGPFLYQI
jgi:putative endonuclease